MLLRGQTSLLTGVASHPANCLDEATFFDKIANSCLTLQDSEDNQD